MLHSVPSDLGLHCLPMSLLWDTRHKWVNEITKILKELRQRDLSRQCRPRSDATEEISKLILVFCLVSPIPVCTGFSQIPLSGHPVSHRKFVTDTRNFLLRIVGV